MEGDALRRLSIEWWQSLTPQEQRRVALENSVHLSIKQFFQSPVMIDRAYLKSKKRRNEPIE